MKEAEEFEDGSETPSWLTGTFGPEDRYGMAEAVSRAREEHNAARLGGATVTFANEVRVKYGSRLDEVLTAVRSWQAPDQEDCFEEHDRGSVSFEDDILDWKIEHCMDCFKLDCAADLRDPDNRYEWTELNISLDMSRYPDSRE